VNNSAQVRLHPSRKNFRHALQHLPSPPSLKPRPPSAKTTLWPPDNLSSKTAFGKIFKLAKTAEKSSRRLDGQNHLSKLTSGATFTSGTEVVMSQGQAFAVAMIEGALALWYLLTAASIAFTSGFVASAVISRTTASRPQTERSVSGRGSRSRTTKDVIMREIWGSRLRLHAVRAKRSGANGFERHLDNRL
jgi:hypothetical protein